MYTNIDPMSVINYGFRNPNAKSILTCIPQVIPFSHRINIFQQLLERDRSHTLSRASYSEGSLQVVVRRDHIVEDTFDGKPLALLISQTCEMSCDDDGSLGV